MPYTLELADAFKRFKLDQDKTLCPDETVRRFKERLKKIDLDILESTIRIDNGRLDIPVYVSVCGEDAMKATGTKKQMGKGGTPQQAEASALMELAERFSFFSFAQNPDNFVVAARADLDDEALPFDAVARSVHDESADLPQARRIFESLPLKWARGYNLSTEKSALIPFDWFFAINEFNGPSAGNCAEEALVQGICEVVERHVSSLVSRNRIAAPAMELDGELDPVVSRMLKKYENAGVRLFISDFSLDTGIPTVGVLAFDPQTFPEKSEIVWTAGTTPDPVKSLSRALTETAQLGGDFNTGSSYVASGLPKIADLSEAGHIVNPGSSVPLSALPNLSDDNLKVEIGNLVEALRKQELEVLVVETTHPLLRIPAFYTIVPGAHFRERTAGASVGMFAAKLISQNFHPAEALARLENADRILPNKYYVKFYLGLSRLSLGDPPAALEDFRRALDLDPAAEDVADIHSYAGLCLKEMERYGEALEILEKGIAADPDRTDIHNLMGFCHFKRKDHASAIECFQKILELDPSSAIDYANIASNYRDMGEKDKAIRYYEIALRLDPGIDFARDSLRKLKGDRSESGG